MTRKMIILTTAIVTLLVGLSPLAPAVAHATATIDPTAEGSVTIHRFAGHSTADTNPTPGLAGRTPLDGIEFSLQRVEGVDLTAPEGWHIVESLNVQQVLDASDEFSLGPPTQRTTGTGQPGTAHFPGLEPGVYLITETHAVTKPNEPFLVSVPTPDPPSWRYDVHVYPKNRLSGGPVPGPTPTSDIEESTTKIDPRTTQDDIAITGSDWVVLGLLIAVSAIVTGFALTRNTTQGESQP